MYSYNYLSSHSFFFVSFAVGQQIIFSYRSNELWVPPRDMPNRISCDSGSSLMFHAFVKGCINRHISRFMTTPHAHKSN